MIIMPAMTAPATKPATFKLDLSNEAAEPLLAAEVAADAAPEAAEDALETALVAFEAADELALPTALRSQKMIGEHRAQEGYGMKMTYADAEDTAELAAWEAEAAAEETALEMLC
jgi:hypothetical protein